MLFNKKHLKCNIIYSVLFDPKMVKLVGNFFHGHIGGILFLIIDVEVPYTRTNYFWVIIIINEPRAAKWKSCPKHNLPF